MKRTLLSEKGIIIDDTWHCFMAVLCEHVMDNLKKWQTTIGQLPMNYSFRRCLIKNLDDLEYIFDKIDLLPNNPNNYESLGIFRHKYKLEEQINLLREFLMKNILDTKPIKEQIYILYLSEIDFAIIPLIESLQDFKEKAEEQFENINYPRTDN